MRRFTRSILVVSVMALLLGVVGGAHGSTRFSSGTQISPYSASVLAARDFRAGRLIPQGGAPAGRSGIGVAGVLGNVQASEGGGAVNEVPITSDPVTPSHLLSGGNDYNCGVSLAGFFSSGDGGATWNHNCIGSAPDPNRTGCGDPVVAYDRQGRSFRGSIACATSFANAEIIFSTSANNGATWSAPTVAIHDGGDFMDKEWLQVDVGASSPFVNTLYMSATDFTPGGNGRIVVVHSTDHGVTWSAPVIIHTADGSHVDQFSDLGIGPDGAVYVSWLNCKTSNGCGGQDSTMFVSKSADGGVTWGAAVKMAAIKLVPNKCNCAYYGNLPNTNERMSDIPAIDVDPVTGTIAAAFYNWNGTSMELETVRSTDGGATWSSPVLVSKIKNDQFLPWLSAGPMGGFGVTWLDRRNDTGNKKYETFGAYSRDGVSWGPAIKIADQQSNPSNDGFGGGFMGDYTGNIWSGVTLYASWPDTRSGVNNQDFVGGIAFDPTRVSQ